MRVCIETVDMLSWTLSNSNNHSDAKVLENVKYHNPVNIGSLDLIKEKLEIFLSEIFTMHLSQNSLFKYTKYICTFLFKKVLYNLVTHLATPSVVCIAWYLLFYPDISEYFCGALFKYYSTYKIYI